MAGLAPATPCSRSTCSSIEPHPGKQPCLRARYERAALAPHGGPVTLGKNLSARRQRIERCVPGFGIQSHPRCRRKFRARTTERIRTSANDVRSVVSHLWNGGVVNRQPVFKRHPRKVIGVLSLDDTCSSHREELHLGPRDLLRSGDKVNRCLDSNQQTATWISIHFRSAPRTRRRGRNCGTPVRRSGGSRTPHSFALNERITRRSSAHDQCLTGDHCGTGEWIRTTNSRGLSSSPLPICTPAKRVRKKMRAR